MREIGDDPFGFAADLLQLGSFVELRVQEALQSALLRCKLLREANQLATCPANVIDRLNANVPDAPFGLGEHVADHASDHVPDQRPLSLLHRKARVTLTDCAPMPFDNRQGDQSSSSFRRPERRPSSMS